MCRGLVVSMLTSVDISATISLCFKLNFWTYLHIVLLSKITITTPIRDLLLTLGLCVTVDSRVVWGWFLTYDSSCLVSMLNLVCVHIHKVRLPSSTGPTACFMCQMCLCPWTQLVSCPTSAPHKHPYKCAWVCVSCLWLYVCVYTGLTVDYSSYIILCVSVCMCVFLLL